MEKPGIQRSQYWTRYPADNKLQNIEAWHQFEKKHPLAFGSLYEIWARKK